MLHRNSAKRGQKAILIKNGVVKLKESCNVFNFFYVRYLPEYAEGRTLSACTLAQVLTYEVSSQRKIRIIWS